MSDNLPNQNNPPNPNPVGINPPQPPSPPQSPPTPPNPSIPPNPPIPNDTVDPIQSWIAQHEQRDNAGKFVKSDHVTNPDSIGTNYQPTPAPSGLPLPVQITQNNKYSEKNDPPLVNVSVTNPVTYFKKWVGKFLKNQDIDIHLKIKPFATIGLIIAFATVSGTSFSIGRYFFPNSSPILHRAITLQGTIQRSEGGQYYLSLPDNTLWTLRPTNNNINLESVVNRQVLVKGNMEAEPNVINVKEVIAFDKPTPVIYAPAQTPATNSAQLF